MSPTRICIVGAGPGGMAMLIQLQKRMDEGCGPFEIVCYESQDDWGGVWNYTWKTGIDENGDRVHGAMYRDLWSNGPNELNEIPDYTLLDHFKRPITSFPPREVVFDYIKGRWRQYDLRKYIQFRTTVRKVSFCKTYDEFNVVAEKLETGEKVSETFDYVIVCTSFPGTPYYPKEFPGINDLEIRVMHAHDIRNEFRNGDIKDKRVLMIGSSFSAEDVSLQCLKFGAKEIHTCYNSAPAKYFPPPIEEHSPLVRFEGPRTAIFKDGSSAEVDLVIFCTGYILDYQFMDDNLRHMGKTGFFHENLYKSCMWVKGGNKKLFYFGTMFAIYTLNQCEIQAVWTSKLITKKVALPSDEQIKEEIKEWMDKLTKIGPKDFLSLAQFQTDVIEDLSKVSNYEYNLNGMAIVKKYFIDKVGNLLEYRDLAFKSIQTGTEASVPKIPFMKNFDDSLEIYMKLL